jgi:hypothetical protein
MSELVDTATVLSIKIDRHVCKLFLFDVVDEKYHLIATSEVQSTAFEPFNDIREGIVRAIDKIQTISGKTIINSDSNIIIPSQPDGSGVDHLTITYGFMGFLKIVPMGLLDDVSIQSIIRLVSLTQIQIVDQISMNDPRKIDEITSMFVNKKPDIVFLAGGTEHGATRSILKLVDVFNYGTRLLAKEQRPDLIYAGNSQMAAKVKESVGDQTNISISANIRPQIEFENFGPAQNKLAKVSAEVISRKIGGFHSIASICKNIPMPYSMTISIMTRFLSQLSNEPESSVLVIDMNKEGSILAAGNQGNIGMETSLSTPTSDPTAFLKPNLINEIISWSYIHHANDEIKIFLNNKAIHPSQIPETESSLSIEQALIRIYLQKQIRKLVMNWPNIPTIFNQVIVSGDVFANQLSRNDALLTLLDSIQPFGITNFYLDIHGILPALGSIAPENRFLPVQIIESSAITLLSKVISVQSNARFGSPILKIRVEQDDSHQETFTVHKGSILQLPVLAGQMARIFIEPLRKVEIDPLGRNFAKGLIVQGGLCGVIIDARGRPLPLPKDEARRRDLLKKWRNSLA